ncbi:MAG: glycosyl transferase family 2 [Clostridiaceae bacterium]|nr:glycosyl transferase family 2 [Clostridiaceae bacterium]
MSEKILIITDNFRKITFSSLLSFYSIDFINPDHLHAIKLLNYDAAIVDFNEAAKNIEISNILRSVNPWLPLLIIYDLPSPSEYLDFAKVNGFGQISMLIWRQNYPEEIIKYIQSLIHPGYPNVEAGIALVLPIYDMNVQFSNLLSLIENVKILIEKSLNNIFIFLVDINNHNNIEDLINKFKNNESFDDAGSNSSFSLNYVKSDNYLDSLRSIDSQIMIFIDTDKQYNIADISKIINILKFGYFDMIIGSNLNNSKPADSLKNNINLISKSLINSMLPEGITYSENGLIGMNSTTSNYILSLLKQDTGTPMDLEMLYISKLLKFRVLQIPIDFIQKENLVQKKINSLFLIKSLRKLKGLKISKFKSI